MLKKNFLKLFFTVTFTVFAFVFQASAQQVAVTEKPDSVGSLVYPFDDAGDFEYPDEEQKDALFLKRPANIERKVEYDPNTRQYIIYEKVGNIYYRLPKAMSLKEYVKYDFDQSIKEYWRTRKEVEAIETQKSGFIPQFKIESEAFNHIFGSDVITIKPQGYVEVQFGLESNYLGDPSIAERVRRTTTFDFDNQINISVTGKIGEKVNMDFNYNTEASFDFENKMKLDYKGTEDEILRSIEAGNVSLPLNGTLIQGGTNLFGVKTEMQFGKLNLTSIISQHKGESQVIEAAGGAQETKFEIKALDYDENRHFFLSKYFRDHYNESLKSLPVILTNVIINKVEVWVTNRNKNFESDRDFVAFVDLGEVEGNISNNVPQFVADPSFRTPDNKANGLYESILNNFPGVRNSSTVVKTLQSLSGFEFANGTHWEKVDQGRKLKDSDYTINKQLGFISLNSPLNNDEVLAVAFNYTIGGETFQVGEFATDGTESTQALMLKLLKGQELSPGKPTWELMMKNVYSLGAYSLDAQDFDFNVVYKNDSTNTYINYLPEGELRDTILLRLMNLDNLNSQLDVAKRGDGMFDFIEGVTVLKETGRIIFPVLEPFGENISKNLSDARLDEIYAFNKLYSQTKTKAQEDFDHNKYYMVGSYKGAGGSEIALNSFNLAPGSVKVSAGGQVLTENQDYTVDYSLGRVKIINDALIEAGTPIQVSTESQELITTQRKTMVGSYASYAVSDKLNIGGTLLYMNERPITNKVDMGDEPVSNLMLGLDLQYRNKSKFLTDMVNLLPFYQSKVESSISIEAEVAKLFPGRSNVTGNQIYIDDFEGVETPTTLASAYRWQMASVPQHQKLFPEAEFTDSLISGYNRARMAWYHIDRTVFQERSGAFMPPHLKGDLDAQSNHYTRAVRVQEIFPGKDLQYMSIGYQSIFDLAFYPKEKGPYNFDALPSPVSKGVDQEGKLNDPRSRWAGIMTNITAPNFEASNVEYIEFWMLDPFIYDKGTHKGGDLYFNLGSISEDVLRDSRKAIENGLPESDSIANVDTTSWGMVTTKQPSAQSFNSINSRKYQDVGFDGLGDSNERTFFESYLNQLKPILSDVAYAKASDDPANDDYHYYRGTDFDNEKLSVQERYKRYNNPDGNSPADEMSPEDYPTTGRNVPDLEDINDDNTMNELEAYYQYKVSLRPGDLEIGHNFVVDKVVRSVELPNKNVEQVTWYQFKIPVRDERSYEKIGSINDFKSIRFIRMFLTNFEDSVFLRFGSLNLVRADWRKETNPIVELGSNPSAAAELEMTSINIEENGFRTPVNYVLPPGIEREKDPSSPTDVDLNEQSMLLKVLNLDAGDAKAVYKNLGMDMRQYKRLKLEVHAEALENNPLNDNELSLFVRMGSDRENYYEYEIPLKVTPPSATTYKNNITADRLLVWPEENRLDIDLSIFSELKLLRDAEMHKSGATLNRNDLYEVKDQNSINQKNTVRIKGNPSIGDVEVMHIGVKNPKKNGQITRSAVVWVNELRLSDFDERGGWASNSRMSVRLADLGTLSLSGRTQSVGWGGINDVASQRSLDNKYQVDFSTTAELGKLLPEKVGLHLPVFYSVSQSVATPEYNPLSSDLKLDESINLIDSPEERDALLASSQDVLQRKSFNMNNISIEPERKNADRTPLPTDIENFSVSYAKNEQVIHNVDIENYTQKSEKGVFNYNYTTRSKPIEPFREIKFLNKKYLALIRDFNFSLLPEMISYRTDLSRTYNQRTARNNSGYDIQMPTTVQKDFLWNRYFDFKYDLTRSLQIDFTNKNVSRIDELEGVVDKELDPEYYKDWRRDVFQKILEMGRPVDYQHTLTVNYTIPINKLPLLDWTSARATYTGNYNWLAGPVMASGVDLGNTIRNGQNMNLSGNLNFLTLYNRVPYFKEVNNKYQSFNRYAQRNRQQQTGKDPAKKPVASTKEPEQKKTKEVKYNEKNVDFRADVPKSIFHRMGTQKVEITVLSSKGDTIAGEMTVVDENRINFKPKTTIRGAKVVMKGTKEIDEPFSKKALDFTTRMLLGVRSARVTYAVTGGTELPGFTPKPYLFGGRNDESTGSMLAPTLPFLLGWQDEGFVNTAAKNNWIVRNNTVTKQYIFQNSKTWDFNAQVEPIANVKIDVRGSWREANNTKSDILYNENLQNFDVANRVETGNFEMSILTVKTLFQESIGDSGVTNSVVFNEFATKTRQVIADRINRERGYVEGVGYSRSKFSNDTVNGVSINSSEVIIPAFLSAYTGIDPQKIPLSARPSMKWIRPNWRITYSGNPQQIAWMKDYVQSLNFNHAYSSKYSIGKFETNLKYDQDPNSGYSWVRKEGDGGQFLPEFDISSVNIQESFSPLINMDIGFVNDMSARFEIRKTRNLNLSFENLQMNEMIKNELTFGIGYRFTGLDMIIKTKKKSETVSNDVNMMLDFTSSNYKTTYRPLNDLTQADLSAGARVYTIDFSADYMVSDKLTVKLYYKYNMNDPHSTQSGYLRSNTQFGLSFNFSIM
jgi:cell surface protein SprA